MNQAGTIRRAAGFTLIELLVAMAITAMVAVMAYGGLSSAISARESLQAQETRMRELQIFFQLLGRDLRHALSRPIINEYGEVEAALRAEPGAPLRLELTRNGWQQPGGSARSTLQRVAWRLEDDTLLRVYWPVIDRPAETLPIELPVLQHVSELELRFLRLRNGAREWLETWPPDTQAVTALPIAVRVAVDLEEWGRVERVFLLLPHD